MPAAAIAGRTEPDNAEEMSDRNECDAECACTRQSDALILEPFSVTACAAHRDAPTRCAHGHNLLFQIGLMRQPVPVLPPNHRHQVWWRSHIPMHGHGLAKAKFFVSCADYKPILANSVCGCQT
jgi:predicted anti-sigma-YlaC factor YlaD